MLFKETLDFINPNNGDELNSVSIQVIYSSIRYIKVYSKLLLHNVAMLPIEVKNRKIILKPLNIL